MPYRGLRAFASLSMARSVSDPKDIIGKTDYDFSWGQQDADNFRKDDAYVIETGKPHISEYQLPLPDKVAWIRTEKRPWYNEKQEIIGIVGVAFDISLEKTNQILQNEKNQLNHHTQQIKQFAQTISHDLKTPLWSIELGIENVKKTLTELIKFWHFFQNKHSTFTDLNLQEKDIENTKLSLEAINKQIQFIIKYSKSMLANIEPGYLLTEQYNYYNIIEIIIKTVKEYPYKENQQQLIHCDFNVNFDFWGDENLLKVIINNLLNNAFYYIKTKRKGEIYIVTREVSSSFEMLFKDTAAGTTTEVMEQIFKPYFSTKPMGNGLGLSFCKLIMQSFGGDISVNSRYSEFIEFTLSFPKTTKHELDETKNRRKPTLPK